MNVTFKCPHCKNDLVYNAKAWDHVISTYCPNCKKAISLDVSSPNGYYHSDIANQFTKIATKGFAALLKVLFH